MAETVIKNLHLLEGVVGEKDLVKMEHAGIEHRRFSSISFKIIEVTDKKVLFQVSQGKSAAGNYQTGKRLIEIVHETFDQFFPGRKVQAGPIVFTPSPAEHVTSEWVAGQMRAYKISTKQIAADTGIDLSQITSIITGNRPMSQPNKAMFWFYFLAKTRTGSGK